MAVGIIADDLTGALDSGLQLYRKGLSVSVLFSNAESELAAGLSQVIVLDTETRNISAGEAVQKIKKAASQLLAHQIPLVYKKLDSTLRGNPGPEIAVILDSFDFDAAVLTPVLPVTGRTVRNGVLYVNGVPIADTEFSKDPLSPIETSDIAEIIARDTALSGIQLDKHALYAAKRDLHSFLETRRAKKKQTVLIADAETNADLRKVSRFVSHNRGKLLPCGSAGLLEHLAAPRHGVSGEKRRFHFFRRLASAFPVPRRGPAGRLSCPPVLIVSSSMSEVTRRQIEFVTERELVVRIKPNDDYIFNTDDAPEVYSEKILSALLHGRNVLLDAGGKREELPDSRETVAGRSAVLQAFLSKVTKEVLKEISGSGLGGLAVTGGETAITVCSGLDSRGIRICGEIEPLVPAGILIGGRAQGLPVVTKAGGFGTDSVFKKTCDYFAKMRRSDLYS